MDVYLSDERFTSGGMGQIPYRKIAIMDPEHFLEMSSWITKNLHRSGFVRRPPPVDSIRSVKKPEIRIHEDRLEEFRQVWDPVEVSDHHVEVVMAICKYRLAMRDADLTEKEHRDFRSKVRSKLIQLLEAGVWIDDPRDYFDQSQVSKLQKLNWELEKIDLGRRKDLKYASIQENDRTRLGRRSTKRFPEVSGVLREWIDATETERQRMEAERPYILSMLRDNRRIAELSPRIALKLLQE